VYHVDRSLLDSAPVYRFESVLKQDGNLSVRSDFTGGTSGNPYSKFFNFQDIQLNWETAVTTFPFYENSDYTQDEIHLYPAN
jgi:phenylacetate-coenzyme A ligase PaaK-like adenylate-forming protein